MACNSTRLRALALYKELHRLGRDYPDSSYDFHGRIRRLYESELWQGRPSMVYSCTKRLENRNLTDPEEIEKALRLGNYIKKETLALYSLRKYRHLKKMYPDLEPHQPAPLSSVTQDLKS